MKQEPFAILADDLTGANDTGVQFSRIGRAVLVLVSLERLPPRIEPRWDVLVFNTDSRNLAPGPARARVAAALAFTRKQDLPLLYKKIDSTLRGNVIPELQTLLELGIPRAFLAPAFPLNGRTVEQGVLRVHGIPAHETEAGRDGLSPVASGNLPGLLASAFGARAGHIPLAPVQGGVSALREAIDAHARAGRTVLVCDAKTQADLAALAQALRPSLPGPVLVGSAGLARELAQVLLTARPVPVPAPRCGRVLVAAGSRSEVTREQVRRLRRGGAVVEAVLDPGAVDSDWNTARAAALGVAACDALEQGPSASAKPGSTLLLTLGSGERVAHDRFQLRSERLNLAIGATIAEAVRRWPDIGLVLTGGDVAAAALAALRTEGIELGAEVVPGVPAGRLAGGSASGVPLVTKAGAFGDSDTLWLAVNFLRGGPAASASGH